MKQLAAGNNDTTVFRGRWLLAATKREFQYRLKASSHIACRSPAMPCRQVFRMCLSHLIYTVRPCLIHTCHAMPMPCRSSQGHSTAVSRRPCCAVLWPGEERHGRSMAWAWHGKCESDTAALCKSNGKDTFWTLSGTAWQGNGMDAAWERHAMCESAFRLIIWIKWWQLTDLQDRVKAIIFFAATWDHHLSRVPDEAGCIWELVPDMFRYIM